MSAPRTVDEYIDAVSQAARPLVIELRDTIRAAAPQADERISYGMPSYHLHGRLTYFQAHARHIGLYAFSAEDALLRRAQQAGDVRPDVRIADVAALMSGLGYADSSVTPTQRSRCLALACDSLLTRARSLLPHRISDKAPADRDC